MELDLDVEGEKYRVSVGKGLGDFVWLACYGARLYGAKVYPKGNYLPLLLRIQSQGIIFVPHPRKKINQYLQQNNLKPQSLIIQIPIRKANQVFGENQTRWHKQAFGPERNLMDLRIKYFADKLNRKKEFYFAVELVYTMYEEVKHLYDETEYKPVQEIPLAEKIVGTTQSEFEAQLTLPLGSLRHTLLYYSKEDKNQEFKCTRLDQAQLRQNSKNIFTVEVQPSIPSQDQLQQKVREDMKIQQNLSKALQQKEQQSKKKGGSATLCCYTFEQLWSIIQTDHQKELSLRKYQESTNQRVKIVLQKHLTKLYEIFFYYFILYNQQKEKKEDLVITYQDVMHFLKFYELMKDSTSLFNFFDFYNTDNKIKNVSDTLDLNNGVTFPHFIAILLKATQFIQTSSLMMEGQTFDQSVAQVITKVLQIENNDDEFSFEHRNLRQHTKLIAAIREHSLQLANIFVEQIQNGTQTSENNYHLIREELKVLLGDCGFEGNFDRIVNDCFIDFFSKDKYRKFEGIFFYEFVQVVQWLAEKLVRSNSEEDEDDDGEEHILVLIEKIKFFMGKLTEHR